MGTTNNAWNARRTNPKREGALHVRGTLAGRGDNTVGHGRQGEQGEDAPRAVPGMAAMHLAARRMPVTAMRAVRRLRMVGRHRRQHQQKGQQTQA